MPTTTFREACVAFRTKTVLAAATLGLAVVATASNACETGTDPATLYRGYVDAYSRGSINEALSYFADDAIVTAGAGCTPARPCVGKAAIRERYLAALMARKVGAPLTDQRSDGRRFLRTRGEVTTVTKPDGAMVRLRGGHTFEFCSGRLVALDYAFDGNDAETASFLADIAAAARVARLDGR